jgi:glycerophosphoryl diester phosphodiesterase
MKIIGHRGARGLAPENTIAGLQKALEHGVDMLEFDIYVTKDHVPVLHHDPALQDPNGSRLGILDHTYAQLKEHKADLANLEEVFTQISHSTTLYIEVKPNVSVKPIVDCITKHLITGWETNHLFLASKHQPTLLALHKALPDIPKIVIHGWSGTIATRRAKQVNTNYLAMNQLWLWGGFIAPMAQRNWQIMAYTLNDPRKAKRWAKYGLCATITDYPDRFQK